MTITVVKGLTATQNESGATFDGGAITNSTINSSTIGATTPSTGSFTTVSASGDINTQANFVAGSRAVVVSGDTGRISANVFFASAGVVGAPSYSFFGGTNSNTGMYLPSSNQIAFSTGGNTKFGTAAGSQVIFSGTLTSINYALTSAAGGLGQVGVGTQINGTTDSVGPSCHLGISRFSNDSGPSSVILAKSRSGTLATYTAVISGDALGALNFNGADGTAMRLAAQILVQSDNSAGASSMPGNIQFKTTPLNSVTPSTALTIDSNQNVILTNGSAGLSFLTVASGQGVQAATLLNSPVAGNPSFYIPVRINGTIRFIPAW